MPLEDDRKLWPLLIFFAAMLAVIFTWPEMDDETVRLNALPVWSLLGVVAVTLLGFMYFHRVDHWPEWDREERVAFLKDVSIALVILMTNMSVAVTISAWQQWTYDRLALISLPAILALAIYNYVRRKRDETPEYRR